jgi:ubiquitin conjugation factor E4 B
MKDPVILPSSKTTVDLSTIQRHLLSDQVWLGKVKNPLKDFNVLGTYLKLVNALHETGVILQVWSFLFGTCVQTDPFNRSVLTSDMLIPDVELKARIDEYLLSRQR